MKKISLIIVLLCTYSMFCQQKYDFNDVAPQTSDFIRYGNLPVAKNTGSLDLTIPIHTISTNSFTLPISVKYNSAGFIPAKRDGPVGSDWFLNVGGVIKREVRGIPDESILTNKGSFFLDSSFTPLGTGSYFVDYGFFQTGGRSSDPERKDALADIFSFNVNGISGKFFMKADNTIQVYTNSKHHIKVNMSGFRNYRTRDNLAGLESSTIELTDDRGYTYTFGGDISAIEFSYFYGNRNEFIPSEHRVNPKSINTWYLKEIKAPGGDIAIFEYMNTFEHVHDPMTNTDIHEGMTSNRPHPFVVNVQHNYSLNYETYSSFVNSQLGINSRIDKTSFTLTKEVHLEKIIIPGKEKVEFKYSPKKRSFFSSYSFNSSRTSNGTLWKGYKLDEIKIININNDEDQEQLLNRFDFSYSYSSNLSNVGAIDESDTTKSRKLFLREIEERGKGSYSFDYNSYKYIDPATNLGVDHWGFYNGRHDKLTDNIFEDLKVFVPKAKFDDKGDFIEYTLNKRNPSYGAPLNNLLKKVTYPTGGYSTFKYEIHKYSKRIEALSSNRFINTTLKKINKDEICGGARIKEIKDYNGSSLINSRTFKYVAGYTNKHRFSNLLSSGILNGWPRYEINYRGKYDDLPITDIFLRSATSINRNIANGSHINYSEVVEIQKDGSYSICKFTDHETNPDNESVAEFNYSIVQNRFGSILDSRPVNIHLLAMGLNTPVDNSALRGSLQYEEKYNNKGELLQEISNTYEGPIHDPLNSIRLATLPGVWNSSFGVKEEIQFTRNYLIYSEKKDYYDSGAKTINTYSRYSPLYNKLLSTFTSDYSGNEAIEVVYKYPFSEFSEKERQILPTTITNGMLQDNILPVVGTYSTATVNGKNHSIGGKLTKFKKIENNYKYEEEFSLRGTIDLGVFEKEVTYSKYAGEQPIEVIDRTGIPTTYIWGYHGEYPIAKIVGISVDELNSFFEESINYWNFLDTNLSKLDVLRSNPDFKGLITTYTFKPGIGVTSVTDPRGRKTTYEYDPENRLKYVKDHEGNLVSKTQYHLNTK